MGLLLRLGAGLLARILAVVMAVAAAQAPVYYDQYLQALAGVRQEAGVRYQELEREAAALQLSVEEFIVRHEVNGDAVFQASGRIHRNTLERYRRFDAAYRALSTADAWHKPVQLVREFDPDIQAIVRFKPALTLSREVLVWALCGVLAAWLISGSLGWLLQPSRRSTLRQL